MNDLLPGKNLWLRPSPGRAAQAGQHLHDTDDEIAALLISDFVEDACAEQQFQRRGAFGRATFRDFVVAPFADSLKF